MNSSSNLKRSQQRAAHFRGDKKIKRDVERPAYEAAWYASPLELPERRVGDMAIQHRILPKGAKTPIVGMRQAVLRGITPVQACLPAPMTVHELVEFRAPDEAGEPETSGTWMTDLPEELNQIGEMIYTVRPRGRVCVGGLGLGLLPNALLAAKPVKYIEVVELRSDVIELCAPKMPWASYKVTLADIADFLRDHKMPFDFYLLDTWQGTGELAWWKEVMPLKRIIRNRFGMKPTVHCWAEDMMTLQVSAALMFPQRHWKYKMLPAMEENEAKFFVEEVGSKIWEERYSNLLVTDEQAEDVDDPATVS